MTALNAKTALNVAFAQLRREGFLARQSFKCCSSCASHAFGVELGQRAAAGKPLPRGAVFFHQQDAEAARLGGRLYVRFGQVTHYHDGVVAVTTPAATVDVGHAAFAALKAAGLKVEWNGNEHECIAVVLPKP